jgi:hypothetical protein
VAAFEHADVLKRRNGRKDGGSYPGLSGSGENFHRADRLFMSRVLRRTSLLCSLGVQVERWLQLASMARRAINQWVLVFEAVDVSQEIKIDGMGHFRHVPADLLGWYVVFFPMACNVTVGATHSESPAEPICIIFTRFPAGTPVKIFMFLNTTSAGWFSLPAICLEIAAT